MTKTSSLSSPRLRLVGLMQAINFGWIEDLEVRDGEPILDPWPRVTREIKFAGSSSPHRGLEDVALKREVVEFLETLSRLGDGVIKRLEVRHGIPFRLILGDDRA